MVFCPAALTERSQIEYTHLRKVPWVLFKILLGDNMLGLRILLFCVFLGSCILVAEPVSAGTIHVSQGGSISAALQVAQPGDQVVVECGIYQEQGLQIPPDVSLLAEAGQGRCVVIETDGRESALICETVTSSTIIFGITFKADFSGLQPEEYVSRGGGIYCRESSPSILDCGFENLVANYGAAVYCREQSSPQFFGCDFFGNSALTIGGALACVGNCQPRLETCLLANNSSASGVGGMINAADNSQLVIQSCTFSQGSTGEASDLSNWDFSSSTINNSILTFAQGNLEPWSGDFSSLSWVECSDIFLHDSPIEFPLQNSSNNNINFDPLFCGSVEGRGFYLLHEESPCTADSNPGCGLMGALPVGCSLVPVNGPFIGMTGLKGNYPNPFNPSTIIRFDLKQAGPVTLSVYDLSGRLVAELVDERFGAGHHEVSWSGADRKGQTVAAGVYFVRLRTESQIDTRRMMMIK